MPLPYNYFSCPECRGKVKELNSSLCCLNCNKNYPIRPGAVAFLNDAKEDDQSGDQASWQNLIEAYGVSSTDQTAIDHFVDEGRAALKLLLPDSTNAHILYLSADEGEIAFSLAEGCKQITTLSFSERQFNIQIAKNKFRSAPDNLAHVLSLSGKALPFEDDSFDGIVLDKVLGFFCDDGVSSGWKYSLSELRRVLKPNGWVFLRSENLFSRLTLTDLLLLRKKPPAASFPASESETDVPKLIPLKSKKGYCELLDGLGLNAQTAYGFDRIHDTLDRMVNLSSDAQIKGFLKEGVGKINYFPSWLYQSTVPILGLLSSRSQVASNWVDAVIEQVLQKVKVLPEQAAITKIEINRKCKFVIFVDLYGSPYKKLIVKAPLSNLARNHLSHNYNGLVYLHEQLETTNRADLVKLIPEPVCKGEVYNTPYYVESCCKGRPWIFDQEGNNRKNIISQVLQIFDVFSRFTGSTVSNALAGERGFSEKVAFIRDVVVRLAPELVEGFDAISLPVTKYFEGRDDTVYFFKSDFSVSNLLLEESNISGIIDMDFWGVSKNKLIDYADFLLSYTRNLYDISPSDGLKALYCSDFSVFPQELEIEEGLKFLGGDAEELKNAVIIAWVNTVFDALQFQRVQLNNRQVGVILLEPLLELCSCHQESSSNPV